MSFNLVSNYTPTGDQPKAIGEISSYLKSGFKYQTLWGVTGSGKTFTMANIIKKIQKPTLVIAHNKTLAAQLAQEFKEFFPENAVHYFVSYYDYYQPEAYVKKTDTYIEKEATINEEIDRLRHAATKSLLTRKDVIIVASVSCIYGIGDIDAYISSTFDIKVGNIYKTEEILDNLISMQYRRATGDFKPGTFKVLGDVLEIFPSSEESIFTIEFWGDEVSKITRRNYLTGEIYEDLKEISVFPAKHTVTTKNRILEIIPEIKRELDERLAYFQEIGDVLKYERLKTKVEYDMEMMQEVGYVNGIENYSRYLDGRKTGVPPATLIDYFGDDYLCFIDESHMTVPQIGGMYAGDRSRKENLVENGFRLPSALDNRPLKFNEFENKMKQVIFVSATPSEFEIENSMKGEGIRGKRQVERQVSVIPAEAGIYKNSQDGLIDPRFCEDDKFSDISEKTTNGKESVISSEIERSVGEINIEIGETNQIVIPAEAGIYKNSENNLNDSETSSELQNSEIKDSKESQTSPLDKGGEGLEGTRGISAFEYFKNFDPLIDGDWISSKDNRVVQQVIRPTGLLDPEIEVKAMEFMIDDILKNLDYVIERNERMLVTTLTKRSSEELTDYLLENGYKVRYLHSEVETLERLEILKMLRTGEIDIIVGVNLLREGLDLPEVSRIAILDADKQGFLRSVSSLVQIIGRASRNSNGKVIMYTEKVKKGKSEKEEIEELQINKLTNLERDKLKEQNPPTPPLSRGKEQAPPLQSEGQESSISSEIERSVGVINIGIGETHQIVIPAEAGIYKNNQINLNNSETSSEGQNEQNHPTPLYERGKEAIDFKNAEEFSQYALGKLFRLDKGRFVDENGFVVSESMKKAIDLTYYRRKVQDEYNKKFNIIPTTIYSTIKDIGVKTKKDNYSKLDKISLEKEIKRLELEMDIASANLDFEKAAELRDNIIEIRKLNKK